MMRFMQSPNNNLWVNRNHLKYPFCFLLRSDPDPPTILDVTVSLRDWREAVRWCTAQFGDDHHRWRESPNAIYLCFRDHVDATAFKLRWG
ncbi:MAG: hypothetical protein EOO77_34775 [Oxalobacteraceae bacterium]|nr:MAG: hypothetical protein EOO77_34775 [Oxalobacteraceae bacterium]